LSSAENLQTTVHVIYLATRPRFLAQGQGRPIERQDQLAVEFKVKAKSVGLKAKAKA